MEARSNEKLFDNERVRFLLRRMTERATSDFRKMLNLTVTTHGDKWKPYWEATLPKIKTWSSVAIDKIADEFEADVHNAKLLTEFTYLRYACLSYGKDAYGRKNKLEIEMVTFGTLYHAFLVRLARTPEMMRGTCLTRPEEMDRIAENALSDALHDVSETRVVVQQATSATPALTGDTASVATTVISQPRRTFSSHAPSALVTSDDSASQLHSLGVRHRMSASVASVPPAIREETAFFAEEDAVAAATDAQPIVDEEQQQQEFTEPPREPTPPPVRQPPRVITMGNAIVKPAAEPEREGSTM